MDNETTQAEPNRPMTRAGYPKGSIGSAQLADRPASELDTAIMDNASATSRVAELTAMLHDRLTGVLRSEDQKAGSNPERDYATSKASTIAQNTRNLVAVADIMSSMLDRLEV